MMRLPHRGAMLVFYALCGVGFGIGKVVEAEWWRKWQMRWPAPSSRYRKRLNLSAPNASPPRAEYDPFIRAREVRPTPSVTHVVCSQCKASVARDTAYYIGGGRHLCIQNCGTA
jgi:hypothetical protein